MRRDVWGKKVRIRKGKFSVHKRRETEEVRGCRAPNNNFDNRCSVGKRKKEKKTKRRK